MPHPQNLSQCDLRNRSFRDQNLAGASFYGSDVRGCDFRGAILTNANFQHVKTGQSYKQLIILIAVASNGASNGATAGAIAGAIAIAGVIASIGSANYTIVGAVAIAISIVSAFAISGAVASDGTLDGIVRVTFAFAITFAGNSAGAAIAAFGRGTVSEGILYTASTIILLGFAIYLLLETIKAVKNVTGTDFRQADLTRANFSDATFQNTNFSTAIIDFVNWTGVNFTRCQFPDYFNDSRIIQLCTRRDGRGQNYQHADLKNLHLQGVILSDTDLTGADLSGADLRYANLERSNLSEVQALGSDFTEAILTGACIQHWGINSSTQFTDIQCHYIYLKSPQAERKPASGLFKPGDFEKLVNQFTNTLDFLFRNGIEPQAFDLALHNLLSDYEQAGLSLHSVVALEDGDKLVRVNVADPDADKGAMHQQFMQDYQSMQKQLQAEREQNVDLQKQLEHTKGQLTVYREQSTFLQQFVYHQTNQFSRPSLYAPHAQFAGDCMPNDSNNIQFGNVQGDVSGVAGGDNTGVAGKAITGAAGGDISGTLSITMGQLEDSKDPEALKLADLLKQLKTAIEKPDSGLTPKDRDKALKHIDSIGKLGTEPNNTDLLDKAGDALDALPTIIKRGNGLIEFAEKHLPTITTAIKAVLGGWGISL